MMKEDGSCCGGGCGCSDTQEKAGHAHEHGHDHGHSHDDPFANLDEETQMQIQELQMLEQGFQHFFMQRNSLASQIKETDDILKAVEKTTGEISRIVGNQIVIKSSKDEVVKEMHEKKKELEHNLTSLDEKEQELSKKMQELRSIVLKKLQK